MDVFDNTDFNPEHILSSVFLDPSLDFVGNIEELGDNITVPDILQHLGNSVFFSQNVVTASTSNIENLDAEECNQHFEQNQPNHLQKQEQQQQTAAQQATTLKISRIATVEQKITERLYYDSFESDFTRQLSPTESVAKGIQAAQQEGPQQQSTAIGLQQQQQTCKCEFCEYLQANRISLTGDHWFQCEFCGEGFSNQNSFNQHRCGSTETHFYRCEICHKEYGSSRATSSFGNCEQRNKCDLCEESNRQSHSDEIIVYSNAQVTANAASKTNITTFSEIRKPSFRSGETFHLVERPFVSTPIATPLVTSPDISNGSACDLSATNTQYIVKSPSNQEDINDINPSGSDSECIGDFFTPVATDATNATSSRPKVPTNDRHNSARLGISFSTPSQHLLESSKTYFVLGNVEQIQQSQQSRMCNNSTINNTQLTSNGFQLLNMSPVAVVHQQQSVQYVTQHAPLSSLLLSEHEVTSLHQNEQYDDEDYSSMSEDEAIVPTEPCAKSPNQDHAKTELPIQETIVDTSTSLVQRETLKNGLLPTKATSVSRFLMHGTPHELEDGKCDSSSSLLSLAIGAGIGQQLQKSHTTLASNYIIERPYKCNICERSYRNQKNLKSHLKVHEGIRAYQCEICGKNFSGSSYLVIHRRRHTGERPFKCATCEKAFVDSRALAVHTRLHSGERLKCEKCGKTFSSVSALTVHNRLHTGIHPYKCELCGKTFPQYNNLKHHMKKHDTSEASLEKQPLQACGNSISSTFSPNTTVASANCPIMVKKPIPNNDTTGQAVASSTTSSVFEHKCHICSKLHKSSDDLRVHLNQHSKDRPNQCEFCSKVFPRSSHLIIHRRRHTGERPFKCKYCDKAFVDSRALSVHTRLHTGERVKCEICEKTFASSSGLIVHRRIHTGIHPYKCDYCEKSFAQSTALKYHLKKHDTAMLPTTTSDTASHSITHGIRSNGKLGVVSPFMFSGSGSPSAGNERNKCVICNKHFKSSEYLVRHRRTHSGERPYQCETCGKNFSTMSYLVIHRRRHTSERPYKCSSCEKAFVDSRALQEHARLHTGDRVRCEICQKTYSSVSNLIVHRRIHSGIYPFECNSCGKSFAQKNALKYHLKKHMIQK
uniref:Protein hunchback n=1 Tax=Anopheles atroparvus TaxID=41427 RepID=A0AAG5DC41_ANOAO